MWKECSTSNGPKLEARKRHENRNGKLFIILTWNYSPGARRIIVTADPMKPEQQNIHQHLFFHKPPTRITTCPSTGTVAGLASGPGPYCAYVGP
jgi:hypothetical protein